MMNQSQYTMLIKVVPSITIMHWEKISVWNVTQITICHVNSCKKSVIPSITVEKKFGAFIE